MDPLAPERASSNGDLVNRVQKLRLDGQLGTGTPPRSRIAWLPWILLIGLAFAWGGYGIRGNRGDAGSTPAAQSTTTPSATPEAPALPTTGVILTLKGYIVPAQQIAVSPIDVAGRVIELNVVEGKKYAKGDILAKIEDTPYVAQVDEAKASLAASVKRYESAQAKLEGLMPESVRPVEINQVQAELNEAEAQKNAAQDEVTRLDRLTGNAAAERERNQARFDLLAAAARVMRLTAALKILKEGPRKETKAAAEAEVRSAEADVKAAGARLTQAQWRLTNCVIRSPIDGSVLVKKAELFNLANPNAFSVGVQGGASGSIAEMADLSDLEVDVEIPERDLPKLANVKSCEVKAEAWPGRTYKARLDRVMPIAVRAKSIVNVRVKVQIPEGEEPGTFLKPEMGAVVTFLGN